MTKSSHQNATATEETKKTSAALALSALFSAGSSKGSTSSPTQKSENGNDEHSARDVKSNHIESSRSSISPPVPTKPRESSAENKSVAKLFSEAKIAPQSRKSIDNDDGMKLLCSDETITDMATNSSLQYRNSHLNDDKGIQDQHAAMPLPQNSTPTRSCTAQNNPNYRHDHQPRGPISNATPHHAHYLHPSSCIPSSYQQYQRHYQQHCPPHLIHHLPHNSYPNHLHYVHNQFSTGDARHQELMNHVMIEKEQQRREASTPELVRGGSITSSSSSGSSSSILSNGYIDRPRKQLQQFHTPLSRNVSAKNVSVSTRMMESIPLHQSTSTIVTPSHDHSRMAYSPSIAVTPSPNHHHLHQQQQQHNIQGYLLPYTMTTATTTKKRANSPSSNSSQKKQRAYSRKDKSLGLLCENFIARYGTLNDIHPSFPYATTSPGMKCNGDTLSGGISIDAAAAALCVERRRIYDIINILESIEIVSRRCKNTYNWHGKSNLSNVFLRLQRQAFQMWPEDAKSNKIFVDEEELKKLENNRVATMSTTRFSEMQQMSQKEKSLGRLSQKFVQLFLVGHDVVSLSTASEKILGCSTSLVSKDNGTGTAAACDDDNNSSKTENKSMNSSGMKTKVRRLYDIANVMMSIGIIAKVGGEGPGMKNKPSFKWVYAISPQELSKMLTLKGNAAAQHLNNHLKVHHPSLMVQMPMNEAPSSTREDGGIAKFVRGSLVTPNEGEGSGSSKQGFGKICIASVEKKMQQRSEQPVIVFSDSVKSMNNQNPDFEKKHFNHYANGGNSQNEISTSPVNERTP